MGRAIDEDDLANVPGADVDRDFNEIVVIVEDLKRQLSYAKELNRAYEDERESLQGKLAEAVSLAESRAREISTLREEVVKLAATNDQLIAELGVLNEERREALQEIHRLRHDMDSLRVEAQTQKDRERERAATASEGSRQTELKVQTLSTRVHELEQALQRTQKSLESRASELSQANITVEELRGERDSLKRQLTHFERSRESIRRFRSTLHDVIVADGNPPEKSGSTPPQKP